MKAISFFVVTLFCALQPPFLGAQNRDLALEWTKEVLSNELPQFTEDSSYLLVAAASIQAPESFMASMKCSFRDGETSYRNVKLVPIPCEGQCLDGESSGIVYALEQGIKETPISLEMTCRSKRGGTLSATLSRQVFLGDQIESERQYFGFARRTLGVHLGGVRTTNQAVKLRVNTDGLVALKDAQGNYSEFLNDFGTSYPHGENAAKKARVPHLVRYFAIPQNINAIKLKLRLSNETLYQPAKLKLVGVPRYDRDLSPQPPLRPNPTPIVRPPVIRPPVIDRPPVIRPPVIRPPIVIPPGSSSNDKVLVKRDAKVEIIRIEGVQIARLQMPLVDYDPQSQVMTHYRGMDIAIEYGNGSDCFIPTQKFAHPQHASRSVLGLLANPEVIESSVCPRSITESPEEREDSFIITPRSSLMRSSNHLAMRSQGACPSVEADILALYNSNLRGIETVVDEYRTHKMKEGYAVHPIDIKQLGQDLTDKTLRPLLKCYYDRSVGDKPSWLLIWGDVNYIPTSYSSKAEFRNKQDGVANSGDLVYGSFAKSNILGIPELTVGRIPVNRLSEAKDYLDKLKRYSSGQGLAGFDSILLTGYFEDELLPQDNTSDKSVYTEVFETDIVPGLLNHGFNIRRHYSASAGSDPQRWSHGSRIPSSLLARNGFSWQSDFRDLQSSLSSRGIIVHRGHAGIGEWEAPSFSIHNVGDLGRRSNTPLVLGINCLSGMFDSETLGKEKDDEPKGDFSRDLLANPVGLGEALVRSPYGAIGYIGASRSSVTFANDYMAAGLLYEPTLPRTVSDRRLGAILNRGKQFLASRYVVDGRVDPSTVSKTVFEQFFIYNLQGDPTVEVFDDAQPRLFSSRPLTRTLLPNGRTRIQGRLSYRQDSCFSCEPTASSIAQVLSKHAVTVTIFDEDRQILQRVRLSNDGHLQIDLPAMGGLTVVASGLGIRPFHASL